MNIAKINPRKNISKICDLLSLSKVQYGGIVKDTAETSTVQYVKDITDNQIGQ